ncbi:MAG: hypothetical protein LBD84_02700, partial [Campylobacteraceae bacterium]|nr:hypothetical protein [Campylobacteraceae bacterium]
MNKLIITGHPHSSYEEVEELLHICGMAYAARSIREGFTPQQITETLCKAYGVLLSEYHTGISQIEIDAIWHSMVLDLMLANIDRPFWGWSDPNAIYLLDFWKSVDSNIAFILVYDKPESVFTHYEPHSIVDKNYIKERLDAWSTYNTELLNFYRQNQDRCLLVHAQQVRLSAASYIQQLKVRIGKNLKFPDKILWKGSEISCDSPKITARNKKNNQNDEFILNEPTTVKTNVQVAPYFTDNQNDNPLLRYIAKALMYNNKQSAKVYKELQESANLPLINDGIEGIAAIDAWQAMVEQICKSQIQTDQIQSLTEELSQVKQSSQELVRSLEDEISKAKTEYEDAKNSVEILKQERESLHGKLTEQNRKFNDTEKQKLELSQNLQQAEKSAKDKAEQLENLQSRLAEQNKRADDTERQKASLSQNLQQAEKSAKERAEQLEQLKKQFEDIKKTALEKEKQARELDAKNKDLQIKAQNASQNSELKHENEILLSQLHQVQKELEKYYLENQELKKNAEPLISKLYGAKERVKNTLEYRIG